MSEDDIEPAAEAEEPNTEDVGSHRGIRNRKKRLEHERKQAEEFWRAIFANPIGRREMWGILQACHTFEERFACGPTGFPQPEATWFEAGQQSFGQRLYHSWAMIDRAGVLLMFEEQNTPKGEK
jgi:hypothetical protein